MRTSYAVGLVFLAFAVGALVSTAAASGPMHAMMDSWSVADMMDACSRMMSDSSHE